MKAERINPTVIQMSVGLYEADLLMKAVEEASGRWTDTNELVVLKRFILPKLREARAVVVPRIAVKRKA